MCECLQPSISPENSGWHVTGGLNVQSAPASSGQAPLVQQVSGDTWSKCILRGHGLCARKQPEQAPLFPSLPSFLLMEEHEHPLLPQGLSSDHCPVGGKSSSETLALKGVQSFCCGTTGAVGVSWDVWR